jgi:uncharacterized protein (DUF924 family)
MAHQQSRIEMSGSADVLAFWRDAGPGRWFTKSAAFDRQFGARFHDLHFAAARRQCEDWMAAAEGALALMLLLDQYPRNSFRGTGHMYATDPLARHYARQAQVAGHMDRVAADLQLFFCLPFAHSEDLADQDLSVLLNTRLGPTAREHAEGHRDIIRRFGRFPHRNTMLGRATTAEEQQFLDAGGFAG